MRWAISILICLTLLGTGAGCGSGSSPATAPQQQAADTGDASEIALSPPRQSSDISVEEALNRRSSRRSCSDRTLDLSEIGQLLWAAGGKGADAVSGATRTAPSAGGIYPLELYLVSGGVDGLEAGVYRYDYLSHSLIAVSSGDVRGELAAAAQGQNFILQAPASIVMAADIAETSGKYGERGERYAHIDAGCASQNLALQAEALGLGTVVIGSFRDEAVAGILRTGSTPLVIMPCGYPE